MSYIVKYKKPIKYKHRGKFIMHSWNEGFTEGYICRRWQYKIWELRGSKDFPPTLGWTDIKNLEIINEYKGDHNDN